MFDSRITSARAVAAATRLAHLPFVTLLDSPVQVPAHERGIAVFAIDDRVVILAGGMMTDAEWFATITRAREIADPIELDGIVSTDASRAYIRF